MISVKLYTRSKSKFPLRHVPSRVSMSHMRIHTHTHTHTHRNHNGVQHAKTETVRETETRQTVCTYRLRKLFCGTTSHHSVYSPTRRYQKPNNAMITTLIKIMQKPHVI